MDSSDGSTAVDRYLDHLGRRTIEGNEKRRSRDGKNDFLFHTACLRHLSMVNNDSQ